MDNSFNIRIELSLKNIFKYLSNKVMSNKRHILGHFQRHSVRIIYRMEIIIHLEEFKVKR